MKLKHNFSEIYHDLLPDLMALEVPEEKWADCLNCHHCVKPDQERYLTKCCDYQPSIPNYVVGAILSDQSPALKAPGKIIREKIANKRGITPFGIVPSSSYQKALREDRERNRGLKTPKGHRTSLLCSFYDQGMCTIHKYRADICGSFFCYSTSSVYGKQLSETLQSFAKSLDWRLSWYATGRIRPDLSKVTDQKKLKNTAHFIENTEASVETNYQSIWADQAGREEEYFIACFRLIKNLTAKDVSSILGSFLKTGIEEIKSRSEIAYRHITPNRLLFNEERYSEWLQQNNLANTMNSMELFLLKLFNGKRDSREVVLKAKDFDRRFPKKISEFIKQGILTEEAPS